MNEPKCRNQSFYSLLSPQFIVFDLRVLQWCNNKLQVEFTANISLLFGNYHLTGAMTVLCGGL